MIITDLTESVDIDTPEQFELAEAILKCQKNKSDPLHQNFQNC